MNRLTIEIEPEQHRQIKTLATFSGMTIKEFILSKTLGPQRGAPGDATDRLMGSAKNAARLREAIATPDSEHRVFESVEDLRCAWNLSRKPSRICNSGCKPTETGEAIAASDRGNSGWRETASRSSQRPPRLRVSGDLNSPVRWCARFED
jgi:hypothetical protein